jgi:hypothetical protein
VKKKIRKQRTKNCIQKGNKICRENINLSKNDYLLGKYWVEMTLSDEEVEITT